MMTEYTIRNRWTGSPICTVAFDCHKTASEAEKLGLAVKAAYARGISLKHACLRYASLRSAYLRNVDFTCADLYSASFHDANLLGAKLHNADIRDVRLKGANIGYTSVIRIGERSDGYTFYVQTREDGIWIKAGCRYFPITEAGEHWRRTRPKDLLGKESLIFLETARKLVGARGLLKELK